MTGHITIRWSKLKRDVEARFAPSVSSRVSLFMTGYRIHRNEAGRWSLIIDGEEVVGAGDCSAWRADPLINGGDYAPRESLDRARATALQDRNGVLRSLHEYLSMSVEAAIESPDLLIRCLGVLDRRFGKRRLVLRAATPDLHPTERRCLDFRCKAEGMHA
jgi:hypothetical protein